MQEYSKTIRSYIVEIIAVSRQQSARLINDKPVKVHQTSNPHLS